jgi:hypothetical protein
MRLKRIKSDNFPDDLRALNFLFESNARENEFLIKRGKFNVKVFSEALIEIVLNENVITKKYEKLRYIIKGKAFFDFEEKISPVLSFFFQQNSHFNLDGFFLFALREYKDRINEMLYIIIKSSLPLE